jgi:uridylate kinase
MKNPAAVKYDHLTFDSALDQKLGVMDLTALVLCRDHDMPIKVFKMTKPGALLSIVVGENEGTLVDNGAE